MKLLLKLLIPVLALLVIPNIFLSRQYYNQYIKTLKETQSINIDQTEKIIDNNFFNIKNTIEDTVNEILSDSAIIDSFIQVSLYPDVKMYQRALIDNIFNKQKDLKMDRMELCNIRGKVMATGMTRLEFNYDVSNSLINEIKKDEISFKISWYSPGRRINPSPVLAAVYPISGERERYGYLIVGVKLNKKLLENIPAGYEIILHTKSHIIASTLKADALPTMAQLTEDKGNLTIGTNSLLYYSKELLNKKLYSTTVVSKKHKHFKLEVIKDQFILYNVILLLLFIIIAVWIWHANIDPISNLNTAIKNSISGREYALQIKIGKDELSELNNNISKMLSGHEKQREKLLHTENVAAWREVARKLAHEIKNPLFPIQVSMEALYRSYNRLPAGKKDNKFTDNIKSTLGMVKDEINKMTRIISDFSEYARMSAPVLKKENINEIIKNVTNLQSNIDPKIKREIKLNADTPLVEVDRDKVQQVILNIIKNALESMTKTGILTVESDFDSTRKEVYIIISDTGEGLNKAALDKIFRPYYTTKKTGTGLGLAICQRIIYDHNGLITATSKKGKGSSFKITLPIKDTK